MLSPIQETVRLPSGLVGDISFAQEAGDWAVVWVHGFGSRRGGEKSQAVEAACSRRGWAFAAFDFRGHGESSGLMRDLRAATLLEDLEAVRGHLASRGVRRFGLIGSSMGGFAAGWFALKAGKDVVPACVMLAPALRFVQARWETLSAEQREQWRITGVLPVKNEWMTAELGYGVAEERLLYPIGELAAKWDRPLLIFHGMSDTVIPYTTSVAFCETTPCPEVELRLIKSGDHRLSLFAHEIAEEACRFLDKHR